jgi:hypothetical protein
VFWGILGGGGRLGHPYHVVIPRLQRDNEKSSSQAHKSKIYMLTEKVLICESDIRKAFFAFLIPFWG